MEKINNEREWYDNPNIITNLLIGLIGVIIILSQAFAVKNNLGASDIFRSLLNYNSIYIFLLVYLIMLKTKTGKKYFDFLNIFLILVYFLITFASVFTVFQSFGVTSLISCALNIVILFYVTYTFTKETRFYKELKLNKIPFDEVTNEWYFYIITVLGVVLLVVDLITVETFQSVVLALFNCIYIIMFSRYVYLYNCHLEMKKNKSKSKLIKKEVK